MTTLLELRTRTYSILSEPSTSSLYPDESGDFYVTDTINQVIDRICNQYAWSFLESEAFFDAVSKTTLTTDLSTVDTTISVASTTGFATSGKVMIDQDVISYTGKTATTLTGVTGISATHAAGSYVEYLYPLPTDFSRFLLTTGKLSSGLRWDKVDYAPWYEYPNSDFVRLVTFSENHSVIRFRETRGQFLFRYFKSPTVLSADSDVCTIPAPHALDIVPVYAAGWMMKVKGDDLDGLGSEKIQIAESLIQKMAAKYTHKDSFGAMVRTKYSAFDSYKRASIPHIH